MGAVARAGRDMAVLAVAVLVLFVALMMMAQLTGGNAEPNTSTPTPANIQPPPGYTAVVEP